MILQRFPEKGIALRLIANAIIVDMREYQQAKHLEERVEVRWNDHIDENEDTRGLQRVHDVEEELQLANQIEHDPLAFQEFNDNFNLFIRAKGIFADDEWSNFERKRFAVVLFR